MRLKLRFPSPGLWAFVLLAVVLGLQYLGGWWAIQLGRNSKEAELSAHLADLGRLAEPALSEPAIALSDLALDSAWEAAAKDPSGESGAGIIEIYRKGLDADLTRPFERFAAHARLNRVVLLNPDGLVLYDTADSTRVLEVFDFWAIDAYETRQALQGRPAASPAYSTADSSFKRFYVPIRDQLAARAVQSGEFDSLLGDASTSDSAAAAYAAADSPGSVQAILCLVAGRDYLAKIGQLALGLRRAGFVLTALMAVIALLIWRLMARQRHMERQAAEADRLAGLGTLAAGFAHEIRNPLGIIRAFTEDLERSLAAGEAGGADHEAAQACRDIIEEVDRMNRLVGQFLSFTRGDASGAQSGRASLVREIESVLAILRLSAEKKSVRFGVDARATPAESASRWTVGIESGQLRQILMNLLLNAIEASRAGGGVNIELREAGRQIEISIRDEGPGISDKDARRIFEPFYTTRAGGSGLGLAISRQIAVRAGGSLALAPFRPGHGGACFILRLPRGEDLGELESRARGDDARRELIGASKPDRAK